MTPICIAFTPDYFVPAAVTLQSIMNAVPEKGTVLKIYCLVTEDIPKRQKDMLERLGGRKILFNYINLKGRLKGLYIDPKYSEAASYRLMLPDLLNEEEKVIYIDCDIVVRKDIASLYESVDLGNNLLAAVMEAPIEGQAERWEAIGCNSRHYFNSGFLIMNLARMREEGSSARLLNELNTDYLEFPDQDALNIVCQGRVMALSPVYNGIRTFFLPQYRNNFISQYSEEDWQKVQSEGTIHYTGGKPWNMFTVKFGEWWGEYRKLPAEIRREWRPKPLIKLLSFFYSMGLIRIMIDFARNIKRRCTHIS